MPDSPILTWDTIYTTSDTLSPEAVVVLNAEKAFNRIEWEYLFYMLNMFGFGPNFIKLIRLIYTDPTASVHTNSISSDIFPYAEELNREIH